MNNANNIYLLKPLPAIRDRKYPTIPGGGWADSEKNTPDHPQYNPWAPWCDKVHEFVISAPTEEVARTLASFSTGDEKFVWYDEEGNTAREHNPWLYPEYTSCEVIGNNCPLPDGVITRDFKAG